MRLNRTPLIAVLLLTITAVCVAQAASSTNDILSFANYLYAQKDYYRAITEYKRFIFVNPSSPAAATAEFQIGMAYMNGEKGEMAVPLFSGLADRYIKEDLGRNALLMISESFARMKKYREAQDALETLLARYPDDKEKDAITVRIGWYLFCQGENRLALESLSSCPRDSSLRSRAESIMAEAKAYDAIPLKSPALAGGLSAVLPGAGQVYTGKPRDGFIAFIINGCLIWAAAEAFGKDEYFAGSLFAFMDVSWYAGNIYNAVNNANKVNRDRRRNFMSNAEVKCGLMFSEPGAARFDPTLAVRISF